MNYSWLTIFSISLLGVSPFVVESSLDDCLASISSGRRAVLRSSEKFSDAMFHWNTYLKDVQAGGVVRPQSSNDVIDAVICASQFNRTVSVKSGGHSYEGYWMGNTDGVVVDLKNLNEIIIDKEKKLVKVGGGTLLGPLMAKLWTEDNGALPHGLQQVIGVGGHTLGGGYGLLSRKYGLLCDRVVEMEVVTAKGELIKVNKDSHPELFFALRGAGGGSFGVVTSFTYKYVIPPETLKVARLKWTADKSNFTDIFTSIMRYYKSTPEEGSTMYVNFGPKGSIMMGATFSADTKDHQQVALDDMLKVLSKPTTIDVRDSDFIDSFLYYSGLGGEPDSSTLENLASTRPEIDPRYFKGKSGYLMDTPPKEIIEKLGELMIDSSRVGFFLLIDLQGGKISAMPEGETSFVHRNTLASAQIAAVAENGLDLMNSVYDLLEPYLPQAYQNYIDRNEKDWMNKYYGDASRRLVEIKNKYDPEDVFKFERSIPLDLDKHKIEKPKKLKYFRGEEAILESQ